MQKQVAILGSTGSIGTQALEVIEKNSDKLKVVAIAAHKNVALLLEQIEKFNPSVAVLTDKDAAYDLKRRCSGRKTRILAGEEGLCEAATLADVDVVLTSMVGFCGLTPTLEAISAGKTIALANKETLVAAGAMVMKKAKEKNVAILPVDSEHSALFQCLRGADGNKVKKLHLTASGGPFFGKTVDELANVDLAQVLKHPNWVMGRKITVDSATLANKGLEVIEARWLFDMDYDDINVVVHRESIIHSMIEYQDGSIIAQMGMPDMRLPIQYAFCYPKRMHVQHTHLDFAKLKSLTFAEPDVKTFKALALAFAAGKAGGVMPCIFNAANEVAVQALLDGRIKFLQIANIIEGTMEKCGNLASVSLEAIYAKDEEARRIASTLI